MTEKEKLKLDIENAKSQLIQLELQEQALSRQQALRNLADISVQEKIEFFDALYNGALQELKEVETNGYEDEDSEHYAWETYITILARDNDKFWKYWNSISN